MSRYVHGQRVVMPPLTIQDGARTEQVLRVLDFSVHPARPPPAPPADSKARLTTLFHETREDVEGAVFRRPVVSRLPCAIVERQDEAWRYQGFMIDEERLIGLKVRFCSHG